MNRTSLKWLFSGICILLFAAGALRPAFGQTASEPAAAQALKTKTELVKLDVTVLDDKGNFVDGLKQDDFRVFDDGVERPIIFFTPVTAAAKVVVVLETSPAVYLFRNEHLAAAYALVNGLGADDEVALVTYSETPREVVPFTTNKVQLLNALGNVQYMMGSAALNLYYTVSDVVHGLSQYPGKKAIILLTTGLDSSPPAQWQELKQRLRGSDVLIFSVGLLGPLSSLKNAKQKHSKKISGAEAFDSENLAGAPTLEKAEQALQSLSSMTGGRAYFPESGAAFAPAYRQIAACLRHEYVVGVAPEHDGAFHKLSVQIAGQEGAAPGKKSHQKKKGKEPEYSLSFRQGYVAPGP